ncbi:hypothetical protein [Azospirillum sp. B4]|uniref:hypothetical protein n=1 Tax=Azospirillum sp. B4 TaxID=95605 RepID=UPI000349A4FC|nr:hypothetical protein [Azospirillum sp. B4]
MASDYTNQPKQFVDEVITVVLKRLGLDADLQAPTELLLGTAIQESGLHYRVQLGGGPARGLFQMEPNTHNDIWANFLKHREGLADATRQFLNGKVPSSSELQDNDQYAAAMCRVHYHRMGKIVGKTPIPSAGDIPEIAAYWKQYYNTPQGKGTAAQFVANWEAHHGPVD